jgi:hypothetical protein
MEMFISVQIVFHRGEKKGALIQYHNANPTRLAMAIVF